MEYTNETELFLRTRDSVIDAHRLAMLFFELTDACDLKCRHCGSSCTPEKGTYLEKSVIEKVLTSVKQAYGTEGKLICLSGGEPLLHPEFFAIAEMIDNMGFRFGITTNGMLLTEEKAEQLRKCHLTSVAFSIDGTEEMHDFLRNKKGAYRRCLEGIQNGIRVFGESASTMVTTVIHKKNIDQLEEMYNEISALGVDAWRLVNMEPIGRANENESLFLDAQEYKILLNFIQSKNAAQGQSMRLTFGCSHSLPFSYETKVRRGYFFCGAGIFTASVLANGDIYACMDIERRTELVQGNAKIDDFVAVWENGFTSFRKDRSDCDFCRHCENRRFCRGDSAHTWNYDTKQPLLCLYRLLQ